MQLRLRKRIARFIGPPPRRAAKSGRSPPSSSPAFCLPILSRVVFSGSSWISNQRPSTKTCFTLVFSLKISPSVTTRFAIFPGSMLPRRSPKPRMSAASSVMARNAASGESPASSAFLRFLKISLGAGKPAGIKREFHAGLCERRGRARRAIAEAQFAQILLGFGIAVFGALRPLQIDDHRNLAGGERVRHVVTLLAAVKNARESSIRPPGCSARKICMRIVRGQQHDFVAFAALGSGRIRCGRRDSRSFFVGFAS